MAILAIWTVRGCLFGDLDGPGPGPPFWRFGHSWGSARGSPARGCGPGHGFRLRGGGVPVSVPGSKVPKVPKVSKSVKKRQKVSKNVIFGIFRISGHIAQKGSKKALLGGGPPV